VCREWSELHPTVDQSVYWAPTAHQIELVSIRNVLIHAPEFVHRTQSAEWLAILPSVAV
jgi:hypothetical protein